MSNQERIEKLVGQINKYYTDAGFVKNVSQQVLDLLNDDAQASQRVPVKGECAWLRQDDYAHQTDCGQEFEFTYDGVPENGFKFCCFCGKPVVEKHETDEPRIEVDPQPDDKEQHINAVAKSFQKVMARHDLSDCITKETK